jgi:glycosyltransferase involved in cell wall biosynthesis
LEHPAILFTGKMDYRPNIDAVLWFVRHVWPLILQRIPAARFYIVGKHPAPQIARLTTEPRVTVTGYVPEVLPYFGGSDVCVVPLRVGGGTRLKVLEAMAAGVPLVSTSLGAEGIGLVAGEHALIADSPQPFADAVLHLLGHPALAGAMAASARKFVWARYDWKEIAPLLEPVYAAIPQQKAADS